MEKEGRACRRLKMKLPLQFKYFEGGKSFHSLEGEVEDVGARGVAMVIDRPMETGQKLLVTLFLPLAENIRSISGRVLSPEVRFQPVLALADAVWCHAESANKYKVGVKFLFPEQHHEQRLIEFLSDYQLDCAFLAGNANPLEAGNA